MFWSIPSKTKETTIYGLDKKKQPFMVLWLLELEMVTIMKDNHIRKREKSDPLGTVIESVDLLALVAMLALLKEENDKGESSASETLHSWYTYDLGST